MSNWGNDYLAHHGILGMKWGVRRYQNSDGSLTSAGRKRYGVGDEKTSENRTPKKAKPRGFMAKLKANVAEQRRKAKEKEEAERSANRERLEAEGKELDNRLKNAYSADDAKKILADKIYNDLEKADNEKTKVQRFFDTEADYDFAKYVVDDLVKQAISVSSSEQRKSMSFGREVLEIFTSAAGQNEFNTSGYKKLGEMYEDRKKSDPGLKRTRDDWHDKIVEETYREERAAEREREKKQKEYTEHARKTREDRVKKAYSDEVDKIYSRYKPGSIDFDSAMRQARFEYEQGMDDIAREYDYDW